MQRQTIGSKDAPLQRLVQRLPWGGPAGAENGTFYPIDRLRTGERKFTGYGAEVFAHGIPPDVCSDFFDGIGRAKNVVVVTQLPEGGATKLSKFKVGALLEKADKLAEIGSVVRAIGEKVDVFRHDAICVKKKGMAGGAFEKSLHDGVGERCRSEVLSPAIAANGNEIGLTAKVVFGRKARIFSVEGHGKKER